MYMIAERGYQYPLKITTIQFDPDLKRFVRQCHIDYINACAEDTARLGPGEEALEETCFRDFLHSWFTHRWVIYKCEPTEINKRNNKPKRPVNLCEHKVSWNEEQGDYIGKDSFLVKIAEELGYDLNR